jgi:17beta-estradiol 17-dehydrogenase / very-long-chain 3-oxoacyl-CoA reductase
MFKRWVFRGAPIAAGFFAYKWKFVQPLDFSERYGEGSWVVVTGASDGIGIEWARSFAKRGFNIVMIARTPDKLN